MQEKVVETLKTAFAADVFETVLAARKHREETVYRHTMFEGEDGTMVFCGFFPKAEIQAFPGLTEEFRDSLKTFNMVGVITNSRNLIELYHLGGATKPFTSLDKAEEVIRLLSGERLMAFLQAYFTVRGLKIDLETMSYEEVLAAMQEEVFRFTTMTEMHRVAEQLSKN
ncbi:MAG: hypothetical protein V3573_11750 [Desulfovibrionaceae bacterium]